MNALRFAVVLALLVLPRYSSAAAHQAQDDPPPVMHGISTTPAWIMEGGQAGALFGRSASSAGDVNGDGFSDFIVGAEQFDAGEEDEGAVFVYHGSPNGLSLAPDWQAGGGQGSSGFGSWVSGAGDVNGDGYSDVIAVARYFDRGEEDEGRVTAYYGSPAGLSLAPDWSVEGDRAGALLGYSASPAGDVNGDGFSDVIVSAAGPGEVKDGRVMAYYGSPDGLSAAPEWSVGKDQPGGSFGVTISGAGDVNGDGYSDVIVGDPDYDTGGPGAGRAVVYYGSAGGLAPEPVWTAAYSDVAYYGMVVSGAGDVNGDGFTDVIVGGSKYRDDDTREGVVTAFHGSAGGLSLAPDWVLEDTMFTRFGRAGSSAGDFNCDGYSDVLVGAPHFLRTDESSTEEGFAGIHLGSADGLSWAADWWVKGDQPEAGFGARVGSAGDVNGDGCADLFAAAEEYSGGEEGEGRVSVYNGATGLGLEPVWWAEGNREDASYGYPARSAGDVNGDGYGDVIVGALGHSNGEEDEGRAYLYHGSPAGLRQSPAWMAEGNQDYALFGASAGEAGDVNGDGYGDVIVSAPGFTNGEEDEGRVYVYHGSPAGLKEPPAWIVEGNQANAYFGHSVGGAGDVNGDGFNDVLIQEGYTGRLIAYYGSSIGLRTSPGWIAETSQGETMLGSSVSGAGDVNGDGYSDVIVGEDYAEGQLVVGGIAHIYYGSPAGLSRSPGWTSDVFLHTSWSSPTVSGAGDVNGDGYSDVIVGAPLYDDGEEILTHILAYYGSPAGPGRSPDWSLESSYSDIYNSPTVSSAGDVNGDGYSDILIGESYFTVDLEIPGRAMAVFGSPSGLDLAPGWTVQGSQDYGQFGRSVSGAGDVDGDGYGDVIVGAFNTSDGQAYEGSAFVYTSLSPGWPVRPRQVRMDGVTPIGRLGYTGSSNAVMLCLDGHTPQGRVPVRLEWEVAPLGSLFGDPDSVVQWVSPPRTADGRPMCDVVPGLAPDTLYHWRVRLRYELATDQPAGRWITIPTNGWNEADLRTFPEQPFHYLFLLLPIAR